MTCAGAFRHHRPVQADIGVEHRSVQEAARIMVLQQGLDVSRQPPVASTGFQDVSLPLPAVLTLDGHLENRLFRLFFVLHHRDSLDRDGFVNMNA